MNKILITDQMTNNVLEEFELHQEDLAHEKAAEYEKHHIDIKVIYPSSVEQLGAALGVDSSELKKLKCSMNEELESH